MKIAVIILIIVAVVMVLFLDKIIVLIGSKIKPKQVQQPKEDVPAETKVADEKPTVVERMKVTKMARIVDSITVQYKESPPITYTSENDFGLAWHYPTTKEDSVVMMINQNLSRISNHWYAKARLLDYSVIEATWRQVPYEDYE
jgi:hypothetical protein